MVQTCTLKIWSLNQQHFHQLGTQQKYKNLGPVLLNQSLHFNKILWQLTYKIKLGKFFIWIISATGVGRRGVKEEVLGTKL